MNRLRVRPAYLLLAALVGVALLLGGCNGQSVKDKQLEQAMTHGFATVVRSYKSGQFMLNGAVLSQVDLSSHFAYLRDQSRVPKRVLLLRSEKSKITKKHLQAMARMALDYHFKLYYDDAGELVQVNVTEKTAAKTLSKGPPPRHDGDSDGH